MTRQSRANDYRRKETKKGQNQIDPASFSSKMIAQPNVSLGYARNSISPFAEKNQAVLQIHNGRVRNSTQ
jgi:hypothetical protein